MNTGSKEHIRLEDGRQAERHITEEVVADGSVKKVVEIFVEPKIEKKLSKRVVEFTRPAVYKRQVESVNEETGEVETHVESVDPNVRMELREHIVEKPVVDTDNLVTKEELKDLLLSLRQSPQVSAFSVSEENTVDVKSVPSQELVKERVASNSKVFTVKNVSLIGIIAVQVGLIIWATCF